MSTLCWASVVDDGPTFIQHCVDSGKCVMLAGKGTAECYVICYHVLLCKNTAQQMLT